MSASNPDAIPESKTLILPHLAHFLPSWDDRVTNPHFYPIAAESEEWLASAGVHPNEDHKRAFRSCNFGLLTAMWYPEAGAQEFRILCDFIHCLFAFDDFLDQCADRKVRDGARKAVQIVRDALKNPSSSRSDFRIGEAFRDFWGRTLSMDPLWYGTHQRIAKSTELYLSAALKRVKMRIYGITPSLDDYFTLHRNASGLNMCFAMDELGRYMTLPEEVLEEKRMNTMHDCVNDIIVLINDICHWNFEQASGETCNIIPVVMKERNLTAQGALEFAGQLIWDRRKLFHKCRGLLPDYDYMVNQHLLWYCPSLEGWIRGVIDWHLEID